MRFCWIFFLTVLLSLLNGCVIPWPHTKQVCGSLCGTVVEEQTQKPIANALVEVEYSDGARRETLSNEDGFFYVPEKNRFYWGILFGVALNHSLPLECNHFETAAVDIIAEGYEGVTVQAGGFWMIDEETACPQIALPVNPNSLPNNQ